MQRRLCISSQDGEMTTAMASRHATVTDIRLPPAGHQNAANDFQITAWMIGVMTMFSSFRPRALLPLGTLALAILLGGCVYYPGYGYYGGGYYGAPYYGGGVVAYDGGWGWRGGWHDRGWYR
jgi:hypothetical protein